MHEVSVEKKIIIALEVQCLIYIFPSRTQFGAEDLSMVSETINDHTVEMFDACKALSEKWATLGILKEHECSFLEMLIAQNSVALISIYEQVDGNEEKLLQNVCSLLEVKAATDEMEHRSSLSNMFHRKKSSIVTGFKVRPSKSFRLHIGEADERYVQENSETTGASSNLQ